MNSMTTIALPASAITPDPDATGQPNAAPLLRISGLKKRFGQQEIIRDISLEVAPGSVTFLIGPSGGGKSTVLRSMNFLEQPSAGEIVFDGERLCHMQTGKLQVAPEAVLRKARAQMPMVFQNFNQFHHRTAIENVAEGPIRVLGQPREKAMQQALDLLTKVGLGERANHYPAQLSGGQKQRVAIARAVAMDPRLILFDEPTSALDPELVSGVLDLIRSLAEENRTMVIVTHEMSFARRLADRVHFIADGKIAESGTAEEIFDNPQSDRLKQFIRSIAH